MKESKMTLPPFAALCEGWEGSILAEFSRNISKGCKMNMERVTTLAVGEEATTLAWGEEATTLAIGEENSTSPQGEENPSARPVGEQTGQGGPFGAY
jgi:hypothetical protein